MAGAGHEIQGKKPMGQLGTGFLKGRTDTRINMVAATITGKSTPFPKWMELRSGLAAGTGELGPAVLDLHNPFQAGAVIWKLGLELLKRVLHGPDLLMEIR
jgi:hypothetical protein